MFSNWYRKRTRRETGAQRSCTGRPALLALLLLVLVLFVAGSALAKTPYERHRSTEGDPGDGVLEPVAPPAPEDDERSGIQVDSALLPFGGSQPVTRFPVVLFISGGPTSPLFILLPDSIGPFASTPRHTLFGSVAIRGW